MVTRGQAYTLEGVLAAILIVTATVYGLQAIDTRAWQDSTQRQTDALGTRASDLLTVAGETGALRDATLCYDGRALNGNRAGERSEFERMLNTTFDSQGDEYNMEFSFRNRDEETETILVSETADESVNQAPPSAATASTTVTLTDGMNLTDRDDGCDSFPVEVESDAGFYAPDISSSELYNIVEVRLIVW